jgi:alkanesulfonate monooxygenase SsuD/methylene tetrahydromethanopterin reductase-like flavin-dependent oxidoreductase (luciferase family)
MARYLEALKSIGGGRLSCVEFDAFAVPRGQRVRRFEQCLEVVKRLWTEDNVSSENDICKLTNVTMTCRPIQQPHPPIWLAANNDRAVKRAARLGDSWFVNLHATIPEITRQLALYHAELAGMSATNSCARAGASRSEFPNFPDALERHAARPCTCQHAPD